MKKGDPKAAFFIPASGSGRGKRIQTSGPCLPKTLYDGVGRQIGWWISDNPAVSTLSLADKFGQIIRPVARYAPHNAPSGRYASTWTSCRLLVGGIRQTKFFCPEIGSAQEVYCPICLILAFIHRSILSGQRRLAPLVDWACYLSLGSSAPIAAEDRAEPVAGDCAPPGWLLAGLGLAPEPAGEPSGHPVD
jgi:hypothetical protein